MPPQLTAFHKSISKELESTMDRVQHLIGNAHWPSVGAYREGLIKRILQKKIPGAYVTSGFVLIDGELTRQIDIMYIF